MFWNNLTDPNILKYLGSNHIGVIGGIFVVQHQDNLNSLVKACLLSLEISSSTGTFEFMCTVILYLQMCSYL